MKGVGCLCVCSGPLVAPGQLEQFLDGGSVLSPAPVSFISAMGPPQPSCFVWASWWSLYPTEHTSDWARPLVPMGREPLQPELACGLRRWVLVAASLGPSLRHRPGSSLTIPCPARVAQPAARSWEEPSVLTLLPPTRESLVDCPLLCRAVAGIWGGDN